MISLRAEMKDNDRWLNEMNEQLKEDWQNVPLDVWAARTKYKVELQKSYDEK